MAGAETAGRRAALLALGATALLFAAGCGGGGGNGSSTTAAMTTTSASSTPLSKSAYVTKMKAIGQSLSTSLNSLGSATTATAAATALAKVQADLRAAAAKIDAIAPPTPIKTQHTQLAKAVRDFADELGPIVTKLEKGNMSALSNVPTLKGLTEIQTASTAISNKGYKIGG